MKNYQENKKNAEKNKKGREKTYMAVGISPKAYDILAKARIELGIPIAQLLSNLIENLPDDYLESMVRLELKKKLIQAKKDFDRVKAITKRINRRRTHKQA